MHLLVNVIDCCNLIPTQNIMNVQLSLSRPWSQKGSGGIAPLILNLGTGWMQAVSITPRPLYPWDRAVRAGLKVLGNRRIFSPAGIWTPDRLSRCPVAAPTGPSRLPRILTAKPKPRLITLKVTVDQFGIPFRSWVFWGSSFGPPESFILIFLCGFSHSLHVSVPQNTIASVHIFPFH